MRKTTKCVYLSKQALAACIKFWLLRATVALMFCCTIGQIISTKIFHNNWVELKHFNNKSYILVDKTDNEVDYLTNQTSVHFEQTITHDNNNESNIATNK